MTLDQYQILFKLYYSPLCNYVHKLTNGSISEEDVVQDVFLHLWKTKEQVHIQKNEKAYLFSAAHNKSMEYIRKNKLQIVYGLEQGAIENAANKVQFDDIAEDFLLKDKISTSIRQLPEKCQRIFVLSKIEGMSHKEIAEQLNISTKTIENQIGKAYKMIRDDIFGKETEDNIVLTNPDQSTILFACLFMLILM